MPEINEEAVAANHLGWSGHLPNWVPCGERNAGRKCSVCGVGAGFRPSWAPDPHWSRR